MSVAEKKYSLNKKFILFKKNMKPIYVLQKKWLKKYKKKGSRSIKLCLIYHDL